MKIKISAVLICKNEEKNLPACLNAIKNWVDEIIILDSGSTDKSVMIAKQYTPFVYETDWPGFGPQKNRAIGYATGDWIFSLDADEIVSPELAAEIQNLRSEANPSNFFNIFDAFDIFFQSYFLNQPIYFGDWRGDHAVCLFKKNIAEFDSSQVHEKLIFKKNKIKIGRLKNKIFHHSYPTQAHIQKKIYLYSKLSAEKLKQQGKIGGLYIGLIKASFNFLRGYLFKLGFLDGLAGLKLAWMNARYTFLKYYLIKKLN